MTGSGGRFEANGGNVRGDETGDGAGGGPNRRQVLRAVGGSLVASGLAGCTTGDPETPTPTPAQARDCNSYETLTWADLNGFTTLESGCYRIDSMQKVNLGTLTIEGDVVIEFGKDAGLQFVDDGQEVPPGLETGGGDDRVFFRGRTQEPGFWKGLRFDKDTDEDRFNPPTYELHDVVIEHAGSDGWHGGDGGTAAVFVGDTDVEFSNAILRENANWALSVTGDADISVRDTRFRANERPARVHPDCVGGFETRNDVRNNDRDRITIAGGSSRQYSITRDQTWRDPGAPYHVPRNLYLDADLTIEGGTEFQFEKNIWFEVRDGTLTVDGTGDDVRFVGESAGRGTWQGIGFRNPDGGKNVLEGAYFESGGAEKWHGGDYSEGVVFVENTDVRIDDCVFLNNDGAAVVATGSKYDFTVENCSFGSNWKPIRVDPNLADGIASSNSFHANDENYVHVGTDGFISSLTQAASWDALDVPYRIWWEFEVKAPFEVAPGTTVEVQEGKTIEVYPSGHLLADASGPDDDPIVFTGAEKRAGHWDGLYLRSESDDNALQNAVLEYGGGDKQTGNDHTQACLVAGKRTADVNPKIVVTDTTIRGSEKYGIYMHDADVTCSNLTFEDIAEANVYDGSAGSNGAPMDSC